MRSKRKAVVGVWSRAAVLLVALAAGLWCQQAAVTAKALRLDGFQDWAWDETRSRMFVSTGSKILMVEPETLAIEDTLAAGGIAETIAISPDGQFLYAGVGERAAIERFDLGRKVMDLEIPLNSATGARLAATAMTVVPGEQRSVVVARSTWPLNSSFPLPVYDLALYDGAKQRGDALPGRIGSFHVLADGSIHAVGSVGIQRFAIGAAGISVSRTKPSGLAWPQRRPIRPRDGSTISDARCSGRSG